MPGEILPSDSLRFLLGGDVGDWADSEIDLALAGNNRILTQQPLVELSSSGLVWISDIGNIGVPYVIADGSGAPLTPTNVDLPNGRFTFGQKQTEVVLSGLAFDVYGAAAMLLNRRAAEYAGDIQSFSGQAGSYAFAGKAKSYHDAAEYYARFSWSAIGREMIVAGDIVRADIER